MGCGGRRHRNSFAVGCGWPVMPPASLPPAPVKTEGPARDAKPAEEVLPGMAELRRNEAVISSAEEETVRLLDELRSSLQKLQGEMDRFESLARQTVEADEGQARLYLQQRQSVAERMAGLESRLHELEQDLERLRTLKSDVQARVLDLTATQQRNRLLRLEESVLRPR